MRAIEHQTQPTGLACMATCLAMLTRRKAKFVDEEFTPKYVRNHVDVPMWLATYGIRCLPQITSGIHQLHHGKLYLATVPSLMTAGLFHQIIIDTRLGTIGVYDPAQGFSKTTQYYLDPDHNRLKMDHPDYDRLAFPLRSWIIDYELEYVEDGGQ